MCVHFDNGIFFFFAGVSYEKDRHEESSSSHGVDHTSVQVCVTSKIVKYAPHSMCI